MKLVRLTLFAALVLSLVAAHAAAFNVSPMTKEISAQPGESYVGEITVFNAGGPAKALKVFAKNLFRASDGNYIDLRDKAERSCAGWLSLEQTRLTVAADGSAPIKYSFRVPEDASGTYWTYIMVEGEVRPANPAEAPRKIQVAINTRLRIGVRFVVNVAGGRAREAEISRFTVARSGDDPHSGYTSQIEFRNTGNYFIKTKGYIEIRTVEGEVAGHEEIEEFASLPGQEWNLETPIESQLPPGEYIALAVLDYGGDSLIAGEARFSAGQPAGMSDE